MIPFPKSLTGHQCVSNCVSKTTILSHPYTNRTIADVPVDYCPIDILANNDDIDNNIKQLGFNVKTMTERQHIMSSMIAPCKYNSNDPIINDQYIIFDSKLFLFICYNISSFDETIAWLNKHNNIKKGTIKRMINCAWKAFCHKLVDITDNIVQYYLELIETVWINIYYKKLYKYFSVSDNKVSLMSSTKEHTRADMILIKKYILAPSSENKSETKGFINILIIRTILHQIITDYYSVWHTELDFNTLICNAIYSQLEQNIISAIQEKY